MATQPLDFSRQSGAYCAPRLVGGGHGTRIRQTETVFTARARYAIGHYGLAADGVTEPTLSVKSETFVSRGWFSIAASLAFISLALSGLCMLSGYKVIGAVGALAMAGSFLSASNWLSSYAQKTAAHP